MRRRKGKDASRAEVKTGCLRASTQHVPASRHHANTIQDLPSAPAPSISNDYYSPALGHVSVLCTRIGAARMGTGFG